jgi:uncharacterized repeat protein (TIGR03803 family)
VQGSDGNFYGTTQDGGTNSYGTVFRISPSGSLTTLWSFNGSSEGANPQAALVQGSDGNFYGTTYQGGTYDEGTFFRISPSGSLTILSSFDICTGSDNPEAGLVQGSDGYFYGTTQYGGLIGNCGIGDGNVFRIEPTGGLSILWSFNYSDGSSDGAAPESALVQGSDGNFYGTTIAGGTSDNGTVFKISPAGTLTTLYSFTGGADGSGPQAALAQGGDGNFYGTTQWGGTSTNCLFGCGTVFKISPAGTLTTLYSFTGGADGHFPFAALVQGSDGNFYGTTQFGGTSANCPGHPPFVPSGCGTVFRIGPGGSYTNLYSFGNCPNDGAWPYGLVQGSDGNLYGTTAGGGTSGGGTLFRLTLSASIYAYTTNSGAITITGYTGVVPSVLSIPSTINGLPVTSIGDYAFSGCTSLTSVTIPNSVTSIGEDAFDSCTSLTAITVDPNNPAYSSVAGVLFDKSQTTLIQYPGSIAGSYTIPNSVTSIGDYAFYGCTSLTSVTIGTNVTSMGFFAFGWCTNLTSVTIPASVTSIGESAFAGCTNLTSVTIPTSVTSIGDLAFGDCTSLNGVYFKGNAPSVGFHVFYDDISGRLLNTTVYYLPGATGFGTTFAGLPTVLWNPQAQKLGVQTNQFGFTITGPSNLVIVVEACTNLANPAWVPLATNTLTGGSSYFSDPQWTNYPARFYRLRSP